MLLLVGCSSFIDDIKSQYEEGEQPVLVGAVWPAAEPGTTDHADEVGDTTAIGGVRSTLTAHVDRTWTYDLSWNLVILDESGAAASGWASSIIQATDESTSTSGTVYTTTVPLSCTEQPTSEAPAGATVALLMDNNGSVASTDPHGTRIDGASALLGSLSSAVDRFGLAAFAQGSSCVPDDYTLYEADGSPWVEKPGKLDASLAALEGCEAGADHLFLDAVDATAAVLADQPSPVIVSFSDAPDSGSVVSVATLLGETPPLFLVRPGDTSDFSDQARLAQASGGALVQATTETIPAAFEAVGALVRGEPAGYRCTATMEVTLAEADDAPGWLQDTLYIAPSAANVQVSMPYAIAF